MINYFKIMREIIHYQDWKTGEEREFNPNQGLDFIRKTNLVCPFDNTPIFYRSYYHNEHEFFCPNCGGYYPEPKNQEEINRHAIEDALKCKDQLVKLKETKADLEARIKQAEKMGLISREN